MPGKWTGERTGAQSAARTRKPVRQTAICRTCGHEKDGVTRTESMTFGAFPIGRQIHFCDDCRQALEERPLETVIADLAPEFPR